MISLVVSPSFSGYRLDNFIKEQNIEELYSRTLIDKLIVNQKVSLNSKIITKKSFLVKENDLIIIQIDQEEQSIDYKLNKEDIPLNILFEDEFLAIINKPAGIVVHPGAGNKSGTLVNGLINHFGDNLSNLDDTNEHPSHDLRPGIVHRLDKETSGLIIITKDNKTHYEMSKLFMNREIEKSYLCICLGVPSVLSGTIDKPIGRHKTDRKKMTVLDEGKNAITHYQTLIDFEYFALLKLILETGRTHQIRVHMESIHHPIIGDTVYNSLKRILGSCPSNKQTAIKLFLNKNINRQILHANTVKFIHPRTNQEIYIEAEPPDDMLSFITFLKNKFTFYEIGIS